MSESDSLIRILLADDHPVICEGLRLLMGWHKHLLVVGEAATCLDVLQLAAREQPDIIVLDVNLRDGDGLSCLPQLKSLAPQSKVIIFTGAEDPDLPRRAVSAGALGWVSKDELPEKLLRAIECVYAGEVWLQRSLMAQVLGELSLNALTIPDAPRDKIAVVSPIEAAKIATLTTREREIIQLIGQGLKNKQIAANLFLSEKTVHSHLASVFQKLEVSDRLELAVFAHRSGLLSSSVS